MQSSFCFINDGSCWNYPIFRGPHEDNPQKVCIVMQIEDESKLEAFMAENEALILEAGLACWQFANPA